MIYKTKRHSNKLIANKLPLDVIIANTSITTSNNIYRSSIVNILANKIHTIHTSLMYKKLSIVNITQTSVFRNILLLTLAYFININAPCNENVYIKNNEIYKQDDYSRDLFFEEKLNNKDIINKNLPMLHNNCYKPSNISIKIQNNILSNLKVNTKETSVNSKQSTANQVQNRRKLLNNNISKVANYKISTNINNNLLRINNITSNKNKATNNTLHNIIIDNSRITTIDSDGIQINTLSIDNILNELWNYYKMLTIPKNESQVRIISISDNITQKFIDDVNNIHHKLLTKRKEFKEQQNIYKQKTKAKINIIKNIPNNKNKKLCLQNFLKEEISNFQNNLKYIEYLKNQHEIINSKRAIIDTYFTMQYILNNSTTINMQIINNNEDILKCLNRFAKTVYENINSFYDTCLSKHDLSNEELTIINDKKNNPKDALNSLNIINKNISELASNSNVNNITNKLNDLHGNINNVAYKLNTNLQALNNKSNEQSNISIKIKLSNNDILNNSNTCKTSQNVKKHPN